MSEKKTGRGSADLGQEARSIVKKLTPQIAAHVTETAPPPPKAAGEGRSWGKKLSAAAERRSRTAPPRLGMRRTPLDEARGEMLDLLEEHGFVVRSGADALAFGTGFERLVKTHFTRKETD